MLAPLGTVAIRIATELPAISVQSAKRELSTNGLTWCEGGSSSVLLCCGPSCRFTDGLNAPFPHPSYEPPRLVPGRTLDQFGGSLIATVTPLRGRQLDTVALASIASITPNVAYWCWSSAGAPGKRRPCWHPTRSAPSAPRRKRRTIRPQCLPDGVARPRTPIAPVMAVSRHCASVLLCAPPAYSKPPPEGVSAHVRAMAQAEDLPVILYDATSRTGIAVADETVACLVESGMNVAINDQAATSDVRRGSAPCAAASW